MLDIILNTRATMMSKTEKVLALMEQNSQGRRQTINEYPNKQDTFSAEKYCKKENCSNEMNSGVEGLICYTGRSRQISLGHTI